MAVLPKLSSGDTKGPASSTDNALARFDGAGGKTLQDSGFIVDDSGYVTSQGVFTELPAGTGVSQGSLYINPASASANETIFGVAKGGAQLFRIDEDGDVEMGGSKVTLFKNVQAGHELHRGAYSRLIIYGLQGVELKHQAGGNAWREIGIYDMALKCGTGWDAQWTLGSNLDQDGVLVKRDVDGDSSYSEAGALLTLQRDVTNVTSEDGNFLECQNAASSILFRIEKSAHLVIGETDTGVRLKQAAGRFMVRRLDDGAGADVRCNEVECTRVERYDYNQVFTIMAGRDAYGAHLDLHGKSNSGAQAKWGLIGGTATIDEALVASTISGANPLASASVNQDGGDILIYGGDHASGGGSEGSVKHTNADGSTVVFETTEDAAGFFAVTPQAQQGHIVDADGTLADITTKFNTLLADLEGYGLLASA